MPVMHGRGMPDLRLPSQPQSITTHWLVPNYTAWWQRHTCVNNLPRVALDSGEVGRGKYANINCHNKQWRTYSISEHITQLMFLSLFFCWPIFPEQFMSVWSLKDHPKYFWTDAMAYLWGCMPLLSHNVTINSVRTMSGKCKIKYYNKTSQTNG